MKFYDEAKPLYIEMDASVVELGAALLQTGSGMSCFRDEASDYGILRPIAITSKSLFSAEKRCNIEREALGIKYGLKFWSLLLCNRGEYNHKS